MKKFWKKYIHKEEPQPQEEAVDALVVPPTEQPAETAEECKEPEKDNVKNGYNADVIDLRIIFRRMKERKMLYIIILPIVIALSALHIFNMPRYYTTETSLAPEVDDPTSGGGLSSIAASFGFDLSQMQTTDAITPLLYPDLMDDNKFVVDLFEIQVTSFDDSIHTDYYSYLTKYQEQPWTEPITKWLEKKLAPKKKNEKVVANNDGANPYILSKKDDGVVGHIRDDIEISVDKKTGVISISATAQDPLICKTLADSVTVRLQDFITKYRTSKAQKDVDYYKHLMEDAQAAYEKVRRKYAEVSDANQDVVLETVKSELEDMENDMQLKYNQYTTYQTQYQAAIAKLRDKTPVFTILKGANVPIKPAGPKRVVFILGMMLLSFFAISLYIAKDEISHSDNQ